MKSIGMMGTKMKKMLRGFVLASMLFFFLPLRAPAQQSQSIPLRAGWNLVSTGIIPPNPAIENVLSGISDKIVTVWAWNREQNQWEVWSPLATIDQIREAFFPGLIALTSIGPGRGYWFNMSCAMSVPPPPGTALTRADGTVVVCEGTTNAREATVYEVTGPNALLPVSGAEVTVENGRLIVRRPGMTEQIIDLGGLPPQVPVPVFTQSSDTNAYQLTPPPSTPGRIAPAPIPRAVTNSQRNARVVIYNMTGLSRSILVAVTPFEMPVSAPPSHCTGCTR